MTDNANHRTRWTRDEDAFLQSEWDGTRETATVLSELLGRTVNAVAQRHYELTWGTAAEPVEVKPEPGDPRNHRVTVRRTTRLEVTEEVDVCPRCWTALPASGVCGYC